MRLRAQALRVIVCGHVWGSRGHNERCEFSSCDFPLVSTTRSGTAIWRLLMAMRHAQKTLMTPPGWILPCAPSQNPLTNMAIMTNWDALVVPPHMVGSAGSVAGIRVRREDSWDSALEALSAPMLAAAHETRDAARIRRLRSWARREPTSA